MPNAIARSILSPATRAGFRNAHERIEMIADGRARLLEPGEDAAVALVERTVGAPTVSRDTICSMSWRSLFGGRVATISS